MSTNKSKKFYNNSSERRIDPNAINAERFSAYRRLLRLAYRKSCDLLSLHKRYWQVLNDASTTLIPEALVSGMYREFDYLECELRDAVCDFFHYSQMLPDPWEDVAGYDHMYSNMRTIAVAFGINLDKIR